MLLTVGQKASSTVGQVLGRVRRLTVGQGQKLSWVVEVVVVVVMFA